MRTLTCLLSLALAASAGAESAPDYINPSEMKRDDPWVAKALRNPISLGPAAETFHEALHQEEVARNLDGAAVQYSAIVDKFRAGDDDEAAGAAALSLFRLAEIRRKQGRKEIALAHYEDLLEEFSDWEPMASLSRQQLGLDPSDFLPQLAKVESQRVLEENVERSIWEIRSRVCDDKFVLVTFEVEPDEKSPFKGLPEAYTLQSLHYVPDGPLTGLITNTRIDDGVVGNGTIAGKPVQGTLITRLTAFGHSFDVPQGLRQNTASWDVDTGWIGFRESSYDVKTWWTFEDDRGKDLQVLLVRLTVTTISEARARELAESRSVTFPKLEKKRWSLTLPPAPTEFEKAHQSK